MQTHPDKKNQPLRFWSWKLNETEKKYDAMHRECLAIVWALLLLRTSLEWTHFTIRTDHKALKWICTTSSTTGKLARRRLRLLEYDFFAEHRAQIKKQAMGRLIKNKDDRRWSISTRWRKPRPVYVRRWLRQNRWIHHRLWAGWTRHSECRRYRERRYQQACDEHVKLIKRSGIRTASTIRWTRNRDWHDYERAIDRYRMCQTGRQSGHAWLKFRFGQTQNTCTPITTKQLRANCCTRKPPNHSNKNVARRENTRPSWQ